MARLDQHLIKAGFSPSREFASEEIRAGKVTVNGSICRKPGYKLKSDDEVAYHGEGRRYVSRGAAKLLAAMDAFSLEVEGRACIDVGASTGGFTQVLLEAGAVSVTAVDVGHDQLDPLLRDDPRVKEFSGFNFREIPPKIREEWGEFDLLTMDVSFISACLLEQSVGEVLRTGGDAVILVKPQFEAGRGGQNKNGVVTDPKRHVEVLRQVTACYEAGPFVCRGIVPSPITGPEGNIEYLCHFEKTPKTSAKEEKPLHPEPFFEKTVRTAFERFEQPVSGAE